ncbi:MAG: hypothetical protein R6W90_17340, partial [Ignavibacteriaceae bacterium]
MNRILKSLVFLLLIFSFIVPAYVMAKDNKSKSVRKTTGQPQTYKLNINNISTFIYADGTTDINGNDPGLEWPKGSNRHPVYQSGFLWGANVNGQIRVGGSAFNTGLIPGAILPDGTAEDPDAADVRMWRVRPDWETGNMATEIREGEGSEADIRAQYEKDWNEWPAVKGAPYEDVDSNGVYDPAIDIPGFPGAGQTIWFVVNDLDPNATIGFYGSPPMGIEMQITIWAYAAVGPLGNMDFRRYKIINKSSDVFDDMYVSVWSDPDVGNATDDFAGVDTLLSLGYAYNATANDNTYLANPPATGFDFFQGPIVAGEPGDTAIFGGHKVPGMKNLPATAFYYFINGDETYGDPEQGEYEEGTLEFYNLLQGKIGTLGVEFPIPASLGGGVTKFPLSGDPVAQTGYLDGIYFNPGDRRYGLSSGPFEMVPGDTQEVVLAQIVAGGAGYDNLQAVQLLKSYSIIAQSAYNDNFVLPSPPPLPQVTVSNLDGGVILSWSDPAAVQRTESHDLKGYTFQGYNIYQLPSPSAGIDEGVRIATYDIVDEVKVIKQSVVDPVSGETVEEIAQYGSDSGIERFISIKRDFIKNKVLINGTRYYYAVTSYAYNPDPLAVPSSLENPVTAVMAIPQVPRPGEVLEGVSGDTLVYNKVAGSSDGLIVPIVIDPAKVTGHTYRVTFNNDGTWDLIDNTTGETKLAGQVNQTGDADYLIVDGILLKVVGPPEGVKPGSQFSSDNPADWGWDALNAERKWTWVNGEFGFESFGNDVGEGGALGWDAPHHVFGGLDRVVQATELNNVVLRLATVNFNGDFDPPFDQNDPDMSYGYRYGRGFAGEPALPEFAPHIVNPEGGYSFQDFTKNVPLSAWNIDDPDNPQRLAVGWLENNAANGLVDGKYWPGNHTLYNNVAANGPREWFFIFNTPYSETMDPAIALEATSNQLPIMYWASWNRRGDAAYASGDEFFIYPTKPNSP